MPIRPQSSQSCKKKPDVSPVTPPNCASANLRYLSAESTANAAAPVLVDLRRTTIYDGSTIETQTLNGSSISASIAIDGTVYTNSQETHNMRIRQQDPVTKLWSMCEINSFLSADGVHDLI